MHEWRESVQQQLSHLRQAVTPAPVSDAGLCEAAPPPSCGPEIPPSTDLSYPDSGFQSTSGQQSAMEDSFLSSGTTDSLKTVRALSPLQSADDGADSADCSLLQQYLSSLQRQEEEAEDGVRGRTETPQPSSPLPSSQAASPSSPPQNANGPQSDGPTRQEAAPPPGSAHH